MQRLIHLLTLILLAFSVPGLARAAEPARAQDAASQDAAPSAAVEDVAVVAMPPYTLREGEGRWSGPAVDLFRAAADRAGVDFRFVDVDMAASPSEETARTTFPVFASADTVIAEGRSLPFHVDDIGLIGGSSSGGSRFIDGLTGLFNFDFLKVVGIVCVLLLVAGAIFWLAERGSNDDLSSDGSRTRGIGDGFWWAGVTATTIGYGDLVPRTAAGRVIAMVWMLFSMALTALLTAYLVSLTGQQGSGGSSLEDAISGKRVAYVADRSVPRDSLRGAKSLSPFDDLQSGLAALDAEEVDVVAYPYEAAKSAAGDRNVQRVGGAVAMPLFEGVRSDALRRELDRIILSPEWQQRVADQISSD